MESANGVNITLGLPIIASASTTAKAFDVAGKSSQATTLWCSASTMRPAWPNIV